jgi:hypothetical protein
MTACPQCGAGVRPGAPYCSLCHADFRPRPAVVEAPPVPTQVQAVVDPLTAPLLDVALPAPALAPAVESVAAEAVPAVPAARAEAHWPCHTCGTSNPLSNTLCGACGRPFLAAASEQMSVVVPGIGDMMRLSRGERIAIAAGGALLIGLIPVLLAVLGKLLS